MRFTKFGKALVMGALSAGVICSVTSCNESYTVGFLYVTGTVTASSGNNGIISGFKIDHNTGHLATINGLPVASGGSNPVRAVLTLGSRFVYVLNRGTSAAGNGDCYGTGANVCQNANITEFAVGGNGILTPQETYFTQGFNPFRLIADGSGNYLMVLDHDAPDNANPSSSDACAQALGTLGTGGTVTTCGDITVFQINQTTGRLSLVQNAQVKLNGAAITYFPGPANPVDFALSGSYLLTLTATPTASATASAALTTAYPYTGGASVWPYSYSPTSGQLQLSQNGVQSLGIGQGTAIVNTNGVIYVLDNEPVTVSFNGTSTTSQSQILPLTPTTGGALQAETSGVIPDDPTLANPIAVILESKSKYLYVANQGNNTTGNNPDSGIAGYFITTAPSFQLNFIAEEPFGSGSGPQCIVEDPSDQFIFEANAYSNNVTGRTVDPNSGDLNDMRTTQSYSLEGPATFCFVDGRTG
jgi:6-phosphogluconolactonase (cycloisomerase 2 family)